MNNQTYLESLIDWGEQMKQILSNSKLPKNEINEYTSQLESWQNKVKAQFNQNRVYPNRMTQLTEEGQQILEILERKSNTNRDYVPYGKHTLPKLPYSYDALEPYISEEIMRLHHNEHHQSYVDGLNKAEEALYKNKEAKEPIKHWLREQAFHGSGHFLHTIFWYNMTPHSSKKPSGELLAQIKKDFTSWKNFKQLLTDVAASVEGVGWAVLVWEPRGKRLAVQSFEKHQLFHIADTIPLLVLDMWEHAYYLQYKTDKENYIKNWWNVVNWKDVNERYKEARNIQWTID